MTDFLETLERQYAARLDERATRWQTAHPEEAKAIREQVAASFRATGKPMPEPGTMLWLMVEAEVIEAVRIQNKWPSIRQWMNSQPAPRQPVSPAVSGTDHKALASGER